VHLHDLLDAKELVRTTSYAGILAIIFAESGLLFGFFLPGDSLLFTAGLFASPGNHPTASGIHLNLAVLLVGCFVAAVAGAQTGYLIGRRVGPTLFRRPDSRFFRHEHVERAERFFEEHGSKTIVLSRFVPIVRTFATVVAGVGRMDARMFFVTNVIGGLLWSVGVTLLGYGLGSSVPNIDRYLLPIIAVILLVSFAPVARELLRARRRARTTA
jgi:membrane-associated protein